MQWVVGKVIIFGGIFIIFSAVRICCLSTQTPYLPLRASTGDVPHSFGGESEPNSRLIVRSQIFTHSTFRHREYYMKSMLHI